MRKKVSKVDQKKIMLNILDYIDFICEKNDIEYSLYAGTLLGAVRHEGFIPWDDDIDVVLTRENYEKLLNILREEEHPFRLLDFRVKNYQYHFAKFCSRDTYQKSPKREIKDFGIFVDIFPLDSLPNEESERKKFIEKANQMYYDAIAANIYTYFQNTFYTRGFVKMIVFFPRYIRLRRKGSMESRLQELNEWTQQYNNQETEFIGNVVAPYDPVTRPIDRKLFNKFNKYKFENKYYKGIFDFDKYLSQSYGDYMKLPAVEDQEDHSFYRWYWKK